MDHWWRQVPMPAVRVRDNAEGSQWELNDAALAWHADGRLTSARVERLVSELPATGDHAVTGDALLPTLRCRVTPVPDGRLLWLYLEEPAWAQRMPATELLALAQNMGRMGVFVRDLSTGEGWWGSAVFEIFGLDPSRGVPSTAQMLAGIVHPEDTADFITRQAARGRVPGRYDARFRIVRPDGEVRHLHSIFELRGLEGAQASFMVGLLIDDTEAATAMLAQREAGDVLRRALALSGVSVWRIDPSQQRIRFETPSLGDAPAARANPDQPVEVHRLAIHPDDREAGAQATRRALESDGVVDVHLRIARADGGWRTVHTRRIAHRDAAGRLLGLLGVSIDVSDLAATREQSQALAERLRLAVDAIGLGFWSRDVDSGAVEWDDQMYRLHHRLPEEGAPSLDEWLDRHVHELDRDWMRAHQAQAHRAWKPVDAILFRIPVPGSDEPRWIQARTRRFTQGGRRLSYGVHVDVTEQQQMHVQLEDERARVAYALEAAGVGVWQRRLDGGKSYLSPMARRLRGLDADDPRAVEDLIRVTSDPADLAAANEAMQRHIVDGQPFRHEFRVNLADGSQRWLASFGRVVRDDRGRPLAMSGINIDVTERKLAESLARDNFRIQQTVRAKNEFMARMSHELRTPLNAVLGFAHLMLDDAEERPSSRQRERLSRIEAAGASLLSMIDEMLELARDEPASVPAATRMAPPVPGGAAGESTASGLPAPVVASTESSSPAAPVRLLCVEDNPVNMLLLREVISLRPSIELACSVDGLGALATAATFKPDALLLDLQLPDISGLEVMRRLRADAAHARCHYVALSANAMPDDIQAALAAGFDDYWTKPIEVKRFLADIDAMVAAIVDQRGA